VAAVAVLGLLVAGRPATLPAVAGHPSAGAPAAGGVLPAVLVRAPAMPVAHPDALPKMVANRQGAGSGCLPASGVRVDLAPWQQQMLRPEAAWPVSQGAGVTVAVVDTGVAAAGVTALAGRVDTGLATLPGPGPDADCVGHGTFLAGLIAAANEPGSYFTGVARQARVLPIRATTEAGDTSAAALAAAIRLAADRHARVILVAPGVFTPDPGLHDAVRYAVARGSLVVAPATLDGQSTPATAYPAGFSETLSVAGIDATGAPASDEPPGAPVELVAPADAVISVGPGGDGNFVGSGTSFAAALVAGVAALALAYRPTLQVPDLVRRLEATAYHPGGAMPDAQFGYGTVDPVAAVGALLPGGVAPTAARPDRSALAMPPAVRQPERLEALEVAGGCVLVLVLASIGLVVVPRGRRRGWRRADR
jgi:subtilisin family serine protease